MNALDPLRVALAGTTLIEASAGTGKTYTIATLFLRLLLERELEVGQILVVTYTRAATAELRDRIRRRLLDASAELEATGSSRDATLEHLFAARAQSGTRERDRRVLEQALRDFDEAAIYTIHGFCQRTLAEHAFESKTAFELELIEQQAPLLREIASDYWARLAYLAPRETVAAFAKQKLGPETLEKLAAKVVQDRHMPVLPEAADTPELELAAFYEARARASALFSKERAAIEAVLCLEGRLSKSSHDPEKIRTRWLPALDALANASPSNLPDCLKKLTPSAIAKAVLKSARRFDGGTPRHPFFELADELDGAAERVSAAFEARALAARREFVRYVRAESSARRRARGFQSFDDLLEQLDRALASERGQKLADAIAARHPAALIDEFQDTDPLQYGMFRRVYARPGASLFLIGDPKQAIYGFRGADVFAYMHAARDAAGDAHTLDVNYRSDPHLVRALNTLFGRARSPFVLPEISFEGVRPASDARERMLPEAPALQLLFVPRDPRTRVHNHAVTKKWADSHLPRAIAAEVSALLGSGTTIAGAPIAARHIAVLCRTNAQARDIQAALGALRIPTVLDGDNSVFESETAAELAQVLRAVAEPSDARRHGAAFASAILGLSGAEIAALRDDEAALEPWLERFARLNQLWHERGFVQMIQRLLDEARVPESLLGRPDGERRLTDLLHLGELLHGASAQQHLGPLSLLAWFARMREDPLAREGLTAESAQIRLEHDERALKLTTIHRSKGLEFPVVFCPYAFWGRGGEDQPEVRFHDRGDGDRLKLDLGSPELDAHRRAAEREEQAENLRLLYVALTRARHRCYAVWGRFTKNGNSALGYLLHQPAGIEPSAEAVEAHLAALDDAALEAELAALCEASAGTIGVRKLDFDPPRMLEESESAPRTLASRSAQKLHSFAPRSSSFSRFLRNASEVEEPEPDHDAEDEYADSLARLAQVEAAPLLLAEFPAGTRAGTAIHAVFEHIDFRRHDRDELTRECERSLRAFGFDPARYAETLARAIDACLRTPLDRAEPPLQLGAIAPEARLSELEFTLSTPHASRSLSIAALARAFETHAQSELVGAYAERLRGLEAAPPTGFFKGFVDLVFCAGGRYYVADYKSNWLGTHARDYGREQLEAAMLEHHYLFQAHLYALAVHRHLGLRLPGYDYERDFGGVYYLFLRGMAPEHPHASGVFFDRPPRALLETLAEVLGADARATARPTREESSR